MGGRLEMAEDDLLAIPAFLDRRQKPEKQAMTTIQDTIDIQNAELAARKKSAHSPLGASGAERWMNCPGSVALIQELKLPESDEPDYRIEGTAAHTLGSTCLEGGSDAWEKIGEKFDGVEATQEMADAVQTYLGHVRSLLTPKSVLFVEYAISAPQHKDFYGTLDAGVLTGTTLDIVDYKHGAGIFVEVEQNPQLMYYAYGKLREHPEVEVVRIHIVQPRCYGGETSGVRTWETGAAYIREWAENQLFPAMRRTELDNTLDVGDHCRFCPAKLVCPMLRGLLRAVACLDPKTIVDQSDETLGRDYALIGAVKHAIKEIEAEVFRRNSLGRKVPGTKMVRMKANRVYKDGAADVFKGAFGEAALTTAVLKSPAEMEKIGPEAKKLVHEWAFTPIAGLTIALASDKRAEVPVQTTAQAFPGAAQLAALDRSHK